MLHIRHWKARGAVQRVSFLSLSVLGILVCVVFGMTEKATADGRSRVLARNSLTARSGGYVRTGDGWTLYVPPHVLRRNGRGTIIRLGRGGVDIIIHAPWRGRVRVTAPLRDRSDSLAHELGGLWVPEGTHRGQRSVWVSQLSPFSPASLLGKARAALCATSWEPWDFVGCVVDLGVSYVSGKVISWVAPKVSQTCASSLVANGISAGTNKKCLSHF